VLILLGVQREGSRTLLAKSFVLREPNSKRTKLKAMQQTFHSICILHQLKTL